MGSLGNDDDDEIKRTRSDPDVAVGDTEAQDFDSQFSPPSQSGEKFSGRDADELQLTQCTLPSDDTLPVEDQFDTQLLNDCGETEVLDDPHFTCDFNTQFIADSYSDGEGTDRTEVLDDIDVLSDEDSLKISAGHLSNGEKIRCHSPSLQNGKEHNHPTEAFPDKQHTAGASDPTAHGESLKGYDIQSAGNDLIFIRSALDEAGGRTNPKSDFVNDTERMMGLGIENKDESDGSEEDTLADNDELGHVDTYFEANLQQPSFCGDGLVRLSYVNSQDPGEASQVNALNFVDRLIKVNMAEMDKDDGHCESTKGKSDPVLHAKGPRSLARSARVKSIAEHTEIFDFNGNQEDEGGGELLCRRKEELLFDGKGKGRKYFTDPRKLKHLLSNKVAGRANSDSKVLLNNSSGNDMFVPTAEAPIRKNLVNKFNEELDPKSSSGGSKVTEADEAVAKNISKLKKNRVSSKKNSLQKRARSLQKRARSSDPVGLTGKTKKIKQTDGGLGKELSFSTQNGSVAIRRQLDMKPNKSKQKSIKSKSGQQVVPDCSRTDEMLVKNQHVQEKFEGSTPIAWRTRNHRMENSAMSAPSMSNMLRETKCTRSGKIIETARAKKRSSNARSNLSGEFESSRKGLSSNQFSDVQDVERNGSENSDVVMNNQSRMRLRSSKGYVKRNSMQEPDVKRNGLACSDRMVDACSSASIEKTKKKPSLEASPRGTCKPSDTALSTPYCGTPMNAESPICMGNDYLERSCRRDLSKTSLMRELSSLSFASLEPASALKNLRKRREMTNVRVLFSHHLDTDTIKQQKKILSRLGMFTASSISDATHFLADKFVRTRNMLEAIAHGMPVVTPSWLESCGQANCFIDEKNYILRDSKKEKALGFNMPVSLARACDHSLLKGQKVLITPNTKPGKEIIASLVKALHGQVVERTRRSNIKADGLPDLLVLSCDEDHSLCIPFLERGAAVYSSELLLNGIVTQTLDYERHRLFVDCVKRTRRSTIWLRKEGNRFRPVASHK